MDGLAYRAYHRLNIVRRLVDTARSMKEDDLPAETVLEHALADVAGLVEADLRFYHVELRQLIDSLPDRLRQAVRMDVYHETPEQAGEGEDDNVG